jgi:hypothetical protein
LERFIFYKVAHVEIKGKTVINLYNNETDVLIEDIRQLSPVTANCIEQILTQYGERAAYLASIALIVYRQELRRSSISSRKDLKEFTYYEEMHETTEAVQLYEKAAGYFRVA